MILDREGNTVLMGALEDAEQQIETMLGSGQ